MLDAFNLEGVFRLISNKKYWKENLKVKLEAEIGLESTEIKLSEKWGFVCSLHLLKVSLNRR